MKRKILLIMCIISMCITVMLTTSTYSKYSEEADANLQFSVGKWNIKLNNKDVTENNSYDFVIENIVIRENENVAEGKIAPGLTGYFDINIDPSDTNVSVRYDLTIDGSVLENSKIKVVSVSEITSGTLVKTAENTYTGLILLEDIVKGKQNTIRIEVAWDNVDEMINEDEIEDGTEPEVEDGTKTEEVIQDDLEYAQSMNNVLKIPLTVNTTQYLGEEIIPYK